MCQILDSKVIPKKEIDDGNQQNELDQMDHFNGSYVDQVDDSCVLYCERFMEFLIDLLSQLPTRRYLEGKKFSSVPLFSG